ICIKRPRASLARGSARSRSATRAGNRPSPDSRRTSRSWPRRWPARIRTPPAVFAPPTRRVVMRRAVYTRDFSEVEPPARYPRHGGQEHSDRGPGPYSGPKRNVFTLGVGGPVGSGKTALVERLCREFWPAVNLAVITNDIYTREDAEFLARRQVIPLDRIVGVETGGCPHSAIREDASINLAAIADLEKKHPGLHVHIVESGGDNLAATFSPELADRTIHVIDVAEGDKIPCKGGPGITRSDLLVINKIDLASHVGADLEVMRRDSTKMRGDRPFVLTSLRTGEG